MPRSDREMSAKELTEKHKRKKQIVISSVPHFFHLALQKNGEKKIISTIKTKIEFTVILLKP